MFGYLFDLDDVSIRTCFSETCGRAISSRARRRIFNSRTKAVLMPSTFFRRPFALGLWMSHLSPTSFLGVSISFFISASTCLYRSIIECVFLNRAGLHRF
jgi:hypothetical protein